MKNIDIDKDNLKNIDIDITILENIYIDIDIEKGILQNIDIDKISYRLGFGISNTPNLYRYNCIKYKTSILNIRTTSALKHHQKCNESAITTVSSA